MIVMWLVYLRKTQEANRLIPQKTVRVARGNLVRLGKTLGTLTRVEAADLAARIQGTVPQGHYMEDLTDYLEVLPSTSPGDFDAALQVMGINPNHVLAQFPGQLEGVEGDIVVLEVVGGDIRCGMLRLHQPTSMADLARVLLGKEVPANETVAPTAAAPSLVAVGPITSPASTATSKAPSSPLRAPTMPSIQHNFHRTSAPAPLRGGKGLAERKAPAADDSPSRVSIPFPSKARSGSASKKE